MATEMTKTAAQPSVLDLLLGGDIPNVEKELPTAAYKIDRLSDLAGARCGVQVEGAALR